MSLTSAQKSEIIQQYKRSEKDTGTPEVQVSLMTMVMMLLAGMKTILFIICQKIFQICCQDLTEILHYIH